MTGAAAGFAGKATKGESVHVLLGGAEEEEAGRCRSQQVPPDDHPGGLSGSACIMLMHAAHARTQRQLPGSAGRNGPDRPGNSLVARREE